MHTLQRYPGQNITVTNIQILHTLSLSALSSLVFGGGGASLYTLCMLRYPMNLRVLHAIVHLSAHKSTYKSVFYSLLLDTWPFGPHSDSVIQLEGNQFSPTIHKIVLCIPGQKLNIIPCENCVCHSN